MNHGVYQFHLKHVAQRRELLEKLKQLISTQKIRSEAGLLVHLIQAGVKTNVQVITRELQGLQVTRTLQGTYVLPDECDGQEKRCQVGAI